MGKIVNFTVEGVIGFKQGESIMKPSKFHKDAPYKYRCFMAITKEERDRLLPYYNDVRKASFKKELWDGMNDYFQDCNETADLEKFPHLADMFNITATTSVEYPPIFAYINPASGKGVYINPGDEYEIVSGSYCKAALAFHSYKMSEKNYGIAAYFNSLLVLERSSRTVDIGAVFGIQMENQPVMIEAKAEEKRPIAKQRKWGQKQVASDIEDKDIEEALQHDELNPPPMTEEEVNETLAGL